MKSISFSSTEFFSSLIRILSNYRELGVRCAIQFRRVCPTIMKLQQEPLDQRRDLRTSQTENTPVLENASLFRNQVINLSPQSRDIVAYAPIHTVGIYSFFDTPSVSASVVIFLLLHALWCILVSMLLLLRYFLCYFCVDISCAASDVISLVLLLLWYSF